jgi:hypothetical protein
LKDLKIVGSNVIQKGNKRMKSKYSKRERCIKKRICITIFTVCIVISLALYFFSGLRPAIGQDYNIQNSSPKQLKIPKTAINLNHFILVLILALKN